MAEVYGVKPKKFTKDWWPYFWMYYKWQTIGIAAAVICIAVTVYQCATKPHYDVNINYAGTTYYTDETLSKLIDELQPLIEDVDGNGEKSIFLQQLNLTNAVGQEEMDYALQTKHDIELSNEQSFLYIYDKAEAEIMMQRENAHETYMQVSDWAEGDIPEDRMLKTDNGTFCAVSAEGSRLLNDLQMEDSELYIAVRMNYSESETSAAAQRSAIAMANAILQ